MRALIAEDDPMIGLAVLNGFKGAGYAVDWLRDGADSEHALTEGTYDLALLDLGLPRRNGLDIIRSLRGASNGVPIIIITARDGTRDRIAGLDSGADDYLVKPFELDELLARARLVVRRRVARASPEMRYGALVVDPVARSVSFRGMPVAVSGREFAILETLAQQPGAVVSREKFEETVYGWGQEIESNCIEVYLHHLRRKLEPGLIRNVRGVGYRLALIE